MLFRNPRSQTQAEAGAWVLISLASPYSIEALKDTLLFFFGYPNP